MSEKLIRAMQTEVRLSVMTDIGAIIENLDDTDVYAMVTAMDLSRQDVGFTKDLIEMLFASLREDLDHDEGKEFLKHLKQVNKHITNKQFGESRNIIINGECSNV